MAETIKHVRFTYLKKINFDDLKPIQFDNAMFEEFRCCFSSRCLKFIVAIYPNGKNYVDGPEVKGGVFLGYQDGFLEEMTLKFRIDLFLNYEVICATNHNGVKLVRRGGGLGKKFDFVFIRKILREAGVLKKIQQWNVNAKFGYLCRYLIIHHR